MVCSIENIQECRISLSPDTKAWTFYFAFKGATSPPYTPPLKGHWVFGFSYHAEHFKEHGVNTPFYTLIHKVIPVNQLVSPIIRFPLVPNYDKTSRIETLTWASTTLMCMRVFSRNMRYLTLYTYSKSAQAKLSFAKAPTYVYFTQHLSLF